LHRESAREISHQKDKTRVSGISFSDIPGQSALFRSYLSDPSSLRAFYPNAFEFPMDVKAFIPTVLQNYEIHRSRLADALTVTNIALGAGALTLENIDLLRDRDAVAIVTGQQTGLFTGPLYTIYKALSAIKLADELRADGIKAVPVFWMATEDHDFDEVSTAKVEASRGGLFTSVYKPGGITDGCSVGSVTVDTEIDSVIADLFSAMPATEFSEYARGVLADGWRAGHNFGEAFGRSMHSLLDRFGLIMLDPLDAELKRLAAPIYTRAVSGSDEMVQAIQQRDRELEKSGFHSQVLVEEDYFPLFWHDQDNRRFPLRKSAAEGLYRARGLKREFTLSELASIAEKDPQRLSPSVMLRAAVQDYILPTAAYFGGGAEIAYFAQNSVVYKVLGRPVTPIFHRQSFTIVEAKHRKAMDKLGIDLIDLFNGPEEVLINWATANLDPRTAGVFSSAEEAINSNLNRIDQHLSRIDTTLLGNLAKRRRKMIYHIGAIRKKALLALSRKNGDAERRIGRLFTAVMPGRRLQERELNVFSFVNKYGLNLIDWIYDAVDLKDKRHRILDI
jgi:bacillithiol synthase